MAAQALGPCWCQRTQEGGCTALAGARCDFATQRLLAELRCEELGEV